MNTTPDTDSLNNDIDDNTIDQDTSTDSFTSTDPKNRPGKLKLYFFKTTSLLNKSYCINYSFFNFY